MPEAVVDTNILVCLLDSKEAGKHAKAVGWLEDIEGGTSEIAVPQQCLREYSRVYWNKFRGSKAEVVNMRIRQIAKMFDALDETPEDVEKANQLVEEFHTDFWDSLIAAVMQRKGIMKIYTENLKDFKNFPFIEAVNPLK